MKLVTAIATYPRATPARTILESVNVPRRWAKAYGRKDPVMTASDTTFGSGHVGFGSFDNEGRMRRMTLNGTPAS